MCHDVTVEIRSRREREVRAVFMRLIVLLAAIAIPTGVLATDLNQRLEGVWAGSTQACEAYLSGRLDKDDMDLSTRRRSSVATIRKGVFSYEYQMASCRLDNARQVDASTYTFGALCTLRGTEGQDEGTARFIGPDKVAFSFKRQSFFTNTKLTRCSR